MSFADQFNSAPNNLATPQTPRNIANSAGPLTIKQPTFIPLGPGGQFATPKPQATNQSFDQAFKTAPSTPSAAAANQPYAGSVENSSPLSFGQRTALGTESSQEGKINILKNMGFDTLQDKDGNLLVRQGDKVFPVDEKGFSIGDIADFLGGQLPVVGAIGGAALGAVATPFTGGIVNPYTGGAAGAGLGDFIRQKIAQAEGSGQKTNIGELGIQAGIGALGPLLTGEKIVGSLLGDSGITKLVSKDVIDYASQQADAALAKGMGVDEAKSVANNIISKYGLKSTLIGRAATNAVAGAELGGIQGTAEGLTNGQSLPQSLRTGFGSALGGALIGPIFGEALHQGTEGLGKVFTPSESIATKVFKAFGDTGNLTTDDIPKIQEFVGALKGVDETEKTNVMSHLEALKPKTPEVVNKVDLPKYDMGNLVGDITPDEIKTALSNAGYSDEVINKQIKSIEAQLGDNGKYTNFGRDRVQYILNKELPNVDTAAKTPAVNIPQANEAPTIQPIQQPKLPKELSGAKPRYKSTQLAWENDVDKALYTVAQPAKNARHDDYMAWLQKIFPGESESQIRQRGIAVKKSIGQLVNESGDAEKITIPNQNHVQAESVFQQPNATQPEAPSLVRGNATDLAQHITPSEFERVNPITGESAVPSGPKPLDINDVTHQLQQYTNVDATPKGVVGKISDWILSPVDKVTGDSEFGTKQMRYINETIFQRMGNYIRKLGDAGDNLVNTLDEVRMQRDRISTQAHEVLNKVADIKVKMTPEEYQDAIGVLARNSMSNPELANRGRLYTIDELQNMAKSQNAKDLISAAFDVTKEISAKQAGKLYKRPNGGFREAKEPAPFFPIFHLDDTGIPIDNSARIEEYTKANIEKGQTPEQAKANAEKAVDVQQSQSGVAPSGKARETLYNDYNSLVASNINTDIVDALQRVIARDSRTAALFDVMAEKGKILGSDKESPVDFGDEKTAKDAINSLVNMMQSDVRDAIDTYATDHKYSTQEAEAMKKTIGSFLDITLKGRPLSEYVQTMRQLNAFKLSMSWLKNTLQPLNVLLYNDMPSFGRGLAAAYGFTDPSITFKNSDVTFGNAREAAVKSGSLQNEVLETETTGKFQKVLDKTLTGLTYTEMKNRMWSSMSGLKYADRLAGFINDPSSLPSTRLDSAQRLETLIGRPVDFKQKVNLSEEDLLRAAYNNTRYTQFGYNPVDLPWLVNTDAGALAAQFKSYSYNQLALLFNSTIGEARSGNIGRATRNMALIMTLFPLAGEGINAIENFLYGRNTKKDQSIVTRYFNDVATVGGMGLLETLWNSPDGKSLALNLVGGPTGGDIAQTADWLYKAVPELANGNLDKPFEQTLQFGSQQIGGVGRAAYHFGSQLGQ